LGEQQGEQEMTMEEQVVQAVEEQAPEGGAEPLAAELEVARGELLAAREEVAEQRQRSEAAEQRALQAYRRALLAEHRDEVIDELVQGASEAELEASLETARSAYQRVAEQARQAVGVTHVPVGAPARQAEPPEALSPLDKIVRGLRR
jgi:hypothetical protein